MIGAVPEADKLLETVIDFLQEEISPAVTEKALQFKLRVALNVLGIVQRELVDGALAAESERTQLRNLTDSDSDDLADLRARMAQSIREGNFDENLGAVADRLLPSVAKRLAIDNPRYSTLVELNK